LPKQPVQHQGDAKERWADLTIPFRDNAQYWIGFIGFYPFSHDHAIGLEYF
jgi:hypothetical protein